jgi:LCP family protein required for cell wall assembly
MLRKAHTNDTSPSGTNGAPKPSSRSSRDPTERSLIKGAAIAAATIVVLTAAATAAAGLLQIKGLQRLIPSSAFIDPGVQVDPPDPGKPETIMMLGTDGRLGADAGGGQRSDTILLARLDPVNSAITLTSIPRDLRVEIPGYGTDKINAAYSLGGTALTVKTVKHLLSTPGHPFKVNHVLEVNFIGFRDLVDYFDCVYVDVDRHYFNDVGGPLGYAVIDINQGYQKLCGDDALSYVRYRHTDSDLVRGARQQDFIRQMLRQPQIRSRLTFAHHKELVRLAGKYVRMDRGLGRNGGQLISLIKLGLGVVGKPVQQIPFAKSGLGYSMINGVSYLEATPAAVADTVRRFMRPPPPAPPQKVVRKAPLSGLGNYASAGAEQAGIVGRDIGIRLYYPKLLAKGSFYVDGGPRVYELHGKPAYRMSIQLDGKVGAYYGIQGMGWRTPPILDAPHRDVVVERRHLQIYLDGSKVAMVAWRTPHATYYVHNTLTHDLSRGQMLAIARSLTTAR